jgi:hypothetical protein
MAKTFSKEMKGKTKFMLLLKPKTTKQLLLDGF